MKNGYLLIKDAANNQFKVQLIAGNGELLQSGESLTTKTNVLTHILAMFNFYYGNIISGLRESDQIGMTVEGKINSCKRVYELRIFDATDDQAFSTIAEKYTGSRT